MEILSNIAATIAGYTVGPNVRQVRYLYSYEDNFKELNDQVLELRIEKELVERDAETERRAGKEIEDDVKKWLNEGDEALKRAQGLCEDPRRVNAGCSRWRIPNVKSRYRLSRNVEKMAENIVKLLGEWKFDQIGYLPPFPTRELISATSDSVKLESRSSMKEDILWSLKDPKVSRMGVYGLIGVGKTTLAREIVAQVKDDKLFDEVVMVTVSQIVDIDRIQDQMADQLGLRFEEKSTIGKAGRLYGRNRQEKAILIILDDIYKELDLAKLGIPLQDNHKLENSTEDNYRGCKLLLTSKKPKYSTKKCYTKRSDSKF
ncbi:disease resistance protein At4g27190-like [Prosopis cineraria]|uniref:disease resistance protein At4g27190-like n=1 Tax=Prosopis cineraria TaxID=364024 RepID=UPI00240FCC5A|nr:disease resistance protein At4g27190-like [Prosopis cineraria]